MAATVSSSGLISVGPKHTPKFATVIKFFSAFRDTLQKKVIFNLLEPKQTRAITKGDELSPTAHC